MQIHSGSFHPNSGWSAAHPVELDSPQTLILVFGAKAFENTAAPFEALKSAFPQSRIAGCSTSGEISGVCVNDNSVSFAIARFEHTKLRSAIAEVSDASDSLQAGTRLAEELHAPDLRSVLVLSDGTRVNGTALVAGLTQGLNKDISIFGGLAGDGSNFSSTWVLDGAVPKRNRVCAIGFYGSRLRIGHGCEHGWSEFGPERRITRSEGNVLYELDGKPALDLYKNYLGELASGLPGNALLFPLAIRRNGDDTLPLVRTILGMDEAQKSMTFAGDMPVGAIARLMRANDDSLIDSASVAIGAANPGGISAQGSTLVISVSCVGRRLVLGERTEEEVETIVEGSPAGARHVGFYSYGEISPTVRGGMSDLHNQTMTVTVLSEA